MLFTLQQSFVLQLRPLIQPRSSFYVSFGKATRQFELQLTTETKANFTLEVEECQVQIFYDYDTNPKSKSTLTLTQGFQHQSTTRTVDFLTSAALKDAWKADETFGLLDLHQNDHKIKITLDDDYRRMMRYEFPENYECLLRMEVNNRSIHTLNISIASSKPQRLLVMSSKKGYINYHPRYSIDSTSKTCGLNSTLISSDECIDAYENVKRYTNSRFAKVEKTLHIFPSARFVGVKNLPQYPRGCQVDLKKEGTLRK